MLRYLGYGGQEIGRDLEQRLEEAAAACEDGLAPAGTFAVFDLAPAGFGGQGGGRAAEDGEPAAPDGSAVQDGLAAPDGGGPVPQGGPAAPRGLALEGAELVLEGRDIARHLAGARACALMAVTLGAESERELARRGALSVTDALLYDAACTSLVESAADAVQADIAAHAAGRGLFAGDRFSPGYGDFPLAAQRPLLAAVDAGRRIGLTATEDSLLVPRKSVTAVVGLFEVPNSAAAAAAADAPAGAGSCERCGMRARCPYAREGRTCYGR